MVKFDRENNPNAALLTSALRSIGYDNVSAISDILDNSLDAEASVISIHFQEKGSYREIAIVDNGWGMDLQTLDQALRLGSDVDSRNINAELGKFGMGLSTASLSLARRLEVFTKQKDGKLYKSVSDVDEIFKTNKFIKSLEEANDDDYKFFNALLDGEKVVLLFVCVIAISLLTKTSILFKGS
ncbi:ATP-binding protein [Bacillus stercoris]|nr:ATP-binding protein [Bacillus stercoris]